MHPIYRVLSLLRFFDIKLILSRPYATFDITEEDEDRFSQSP